jgi:para-nitrobenzyl esterase
MKKSSVLMRRFVLSVSGIFLIALMMGCSSVSTSVSSAPVPLKGVFVDSPVGGINYATPTLKGVTKADGIFEYKAGETVTFSIGSLALGSSTGKPVVTPLDIVPDAKDASDQRVVNISVVLQTLDQDGDPANGILIDEKTASFVTQYGSDINFNKPARAFSFDAGLRNVMAELNNIDAFGATPRAVKPPVVAQKHLEATLAELQKKVTPDKK